MDVFPGKYSSFPGKYLGLPLHYRNVKRIEVQPLIDKIRKRLAGWKGRLLSKAGRETLVKSVLSAQPIYHLTVFPAQKWLLRHIDKIRRSFLWKGEEPEFCSGGHCLVNWSVTCLPKNKGGLGILDLERFARALRLRWLWFRWRCKDKAWTGLQLPCDRTDVDLFHASTTVTIGDGKLADFWRSSWIEGQAPRNIAPSLYKKATRKNITVYKALRNSSWIRLCSPIDQGEEVTEFVSLWQAINNTHGLNDSDDTISWRWTADGQYTTSSAYQIQFATNFSKMKISPIWKAKAEPKCRFFAWTLLHKRVLTADNLQKRGWPSNPICCLCNSSPETSVHLCKDCTFTEKVWDKIMNWTNLSFLQGTQNSGSLYTWWKSLRNRCSKDTRKFFDGLMIYFWWHIWLERNRRVFQGQQRDIEQVAFSIKEVFESRASLPHSFGG